MRQPFQFHRGPLALFAACGKNAYIGASGAGNEHEPAKSEAIHTRAEFDRAKIKRVPFGRKPLLSRPGFSSCAVQTVMRHALA